MKKNLSILAASLLLLGLGACSEEKECSPLGDGTVKVTVYATRGEADTRSVLSEDSGNLNCDWQAGDQLVVTNANGGKLGVLALTDEDTGKFEGELVGLSEGKMNLNYFFLGTGVDGEKVSKNYTFDLSSQEGQLQSLGKYDALSASAEISVIEGKTYVNENLQLNRHFSFAHFTLNFPEGVVLDGAPITITGLNTKATIGFADRALTEITAGTVTVAGTNGDIYVNIIPADNVAPTFKATIDGKEYEGSLGSRNIAAGVYLRKAAGQGVPVQMAEVKTEDPSNPGNTDHWGGDNEDPTYENTAADKRYTKVADADGWTVNIDIYGNGGFCTPITYTSNGIKNNLLTSKGGTAYFFQWGRWLGFPTSCVNTHYNDGGSISGNSPVSSQQLNGVNYYDSNLGYIWSSTIGPSYGTCWMGNNDWTPERANNCSIVFGKVYNLGTDNLDYVGANEECKWEDRSGNPCPDGYRLPTAAELQALIPASGTVNSSCAEIKEIDGIKYAMQWKVLQNGEIPYVEIKSVKTSASSVAVDDPVFEAVKAIRLYAYGYMDNYAQLQDRNSVGVYWSSESGTNEVEYTKGLGGKSLLIEFSGSTAEMVIYVAPRCFGANILPIKDASAKATPLTPWLPKRK